IFCRIGSGGGTEWHENELRTCVCGPFRPHRPLPGTLLPLLIAHQPGSPIASSASPSCRPPPRRGTATQPSQAPDVRACASAQCPSSTRSIPQSASASFDSPHSRCVPSCAHPPHCLRCASDSAPRAVSPSCSGTPPQSHACHILCPLPP